MRHKVVDCSLDTCVVLGEQPLSPEEKRALSEQQSTMPRILQCQGFAQYSANNAGKISDGAE